MPKLALFVSDETYQKMLLSSLRVRGSISLENPSQANFIAYAQPRPRKHPRKVQQLPHGRTEIFGDHVRLTLRVDGTPSDFTAQTIHEEARDASRFVARNGYTSFGYEA